MKLVETILRPGRIAWVLPQHPSAQAANRTFRLATSRWGGRYDVIVQRDSDEPLSDFAASALTLADPDYVVSVDSLIGWHDWQPELARLRIQPFETGHLPNSFDGHAEWAALLRPRPTTTGDEKSVPCRAESGTGFDWRRAAEDGLLADDDPFFTATDDETAPTAIEAASEGLTQRAAALGRWLLVGDPSLELACRFWTLRALGARLTWHSLGWIGPTSRLTPRDRLRNVNANVYSPELSDAELTALIAGHGLRARVATDDLGDHLRRDFVEGAEYARQAIAVAAHRERLHVTLPVPDTRGRPLSLAVLGVVEHRLRSLDPESPDGVMLDTDEASRTLLGKGSSADPRVTRRGFAVEQRVAEASPQSVPVVGFREAVAAPLVAAGYTVELSDKGRFQTKTLDQARSLRFLAWVFTQSESRHLLAMFDEHHLPDQRARESYRRSVTYEELRERLHWRLRSGQRRLTADRHRRAEIWLKQWADQLLDREMLVGGFHLKCPECLFGHFYPIERVDARFRCDRCHATSVVPADAHHRLRLGELFDTLRRQNGDVVTLVLAWLRREADESLLYLPEINLLSDGTLVAEADFAALVDGRLAIGEAKSTRSIAKKEVQKLASAARRANASRLIFATFLDEPACGTSRCEGCVEDGRPDPDHAWTKGTRRHIREARVSLEPHGISVVSLRGRQLVADPAAKLGELALSERAFDATPKARGRRLR